MQIFTKVMVVLTLATALTAQPAKNSGDQSGKKDAESAESKPPENFYRLAVAVYEVQDSKRVNQRDYSLIAKANSSPAKISVGTRVPVFTEEKRLQYLDVGFNLNCSLRDFAGGRELPAGKLQVQCDATISNIIRPEQPESHATGDPAAPVMRNTNSSSSTIVTLGKPIVIASADDVNSARRTQIEVTATKME